MQLRRLGYAIAATLLATFVTLGQALSDFSVDTVTEFDSAWRAADDNDVLIKLVSKPMTSPKAALMPMSIAK